MKESRCITEPVCPAVPLPPACRHHPFTSRLKLPSHQPTDRTLIKTDRSSPYEIFSMTFSKFTDFLRCKQSALRFAPADSPRGQGQSIYSSCSFKVRGKRRVGRQGEQGLTLREEMVPFMIPYTIISWGFWDFLWIYLPGMVVQKLHFFLWLVNSPGFKCIRKKQKRLKPQY